MGQDSEVSRANLQALPQLHSRAGHKTQNGKEGGTCGTSRVNQPYGLSVSKAAGFVQLISVLLAESLVAAQHQWSSRSQEASDGLPALLALSQSTDLK